MTANPFYEMPAGNAIPLEIAPRLASWMAKGHPDQVRLAAFLDHAEELVRPQVDALGEDLAIRLDVGIPPEVDHLRHHDLDNYLYTLVQRLEAKRFSSAWATKSPGGQSYIRVEESSPCRVPEPRLHVRTTRSATTTAWKEEVRDQLGHVAELPPGPVELQISFGVAPIRNWANLWKQAIDALEPLLGSSDPNRDWNPDDGRITILGLHKALDQGLGNAVEIEVSARQ